MLLDFTKNRQRTNVQVMVEFFFNLFDKIKVFLNWNLTLGCLAERKNFWDDRLGFIWLGKIRKNLLNHTGYNVSILVLWALSNSIFGNSSFFLRQIIGLFLRLIILVFGLFKIFLIIFINWNLLVNVDLFWKRS